MQNSFTYEVEFNSERLVFRSLVVQNLLFCHLFGTSFSQFCTSFVKEFFNILDVIKIKILIMFVYCSV